MSPFAFVFIGVVTGFIGSGLFNRTGEGAFVDMIIGVLGAFAGRAVFVSYSGTPEADGISLPGAAAAVFMAAILLFAYHSLRDLQAPRPKKQRKQPQPH